MVAITAQDKEDLAAQSFEEKNDGRLMSPAAAKRMGMLDPPRCRVAAPYCVCSPLWGCSSMRLSVKTANG